MRDFDLRALQLSELRMLKDFDDFCRQNGIVYFLSDGTLLGAVRHQGFIPWDDDVDVCMDVENYRKFMRIADKLPERYFFQSFRTDPKYPLRWPKLRTNGTTCMTASLSGLDMHFGVGMDIFILSGIPKTKAGQAMQRFASLLLTALLYKDEARVWERSLPWVLRAFYTAVPDPVRLWLARGAERLLLRGTRGAERVFSCYYDLQNGYECAHPAEDFAADQRVDMLFEDALLPCPRQYDRVLTEIFGDWRTPPSEDEREDHGDLIVDLEHDYKQYYTGD